MQTVISVDLDGTLALGVKSHITVMVPNYKLIHRLKTLKENTNVYIKIVTARGSKGKLTTDEKEKRYLDHISNFLRQYDIPFDEISFNKEYADLYIDDMTIGQFDDFYGQVQPFTQNEIIFTDTTVIKKCDTSLFEFDWYKKAYFLSTPEVLFCNDQTIITERIYGREATSNEFIKLIRMMGDREIENAPFYTYTENIKIHKDATPKVRQIIDELKEHKPTFFHGDLSIDNVIVNEHHELYLIDPNYKNIFGSSLTDAAKAFFSFIAYRGDYNSAKLISNEFGNKIIPFAVAEGLRVCKYQERFISMVNNIADLK